MRFDRHSVFAGVLKEPTYAGAYAYGRTTSRMEVVDGILHKTAVRKPDRVDSRASRRLHSWAEFKRVRKMLKDNAAGFESNQGPWCTEEGSCAARRTTALRPLWPQVDGRVLGHWVVYVSPSLLLRMTRSGSKSFS